MIVQKCKILTRNTIVCVIVWHLSIITILFSQSIYPQFDQINIENGLSNYCINNIMKDSRGFIWIVTADGINRYDGYKFKIFKYDPDDSTSLSGNFVYSITEDRDGNLWACTRSNGLSKLDRKTGKFSRINLYAPDASLEKKRLFSRTYYVYEDPYEEEIVLWVTSEGKKSMNLYKDGAKNYYIGVVIGQNFAATDSFNIWHGTTVGLRKLNKRTEKDIPYFYKKTQSGADISVVNMYLDNDGLLWLACWYDGLIIFDTKTETFIGHKYNPDHPQGVGSNVVFDVNADKTGNLWLVTSGNGYYQYDKNHDQFICYKKPKTYTRLGLNYWGQAYIDDTNIHWIGTKNDGLFKYAPKKDKFNQFSLSTEKESDVDVRAFYRDDTDSLWVSTVDALYKFDTQSNVFSKTKYDINHVHKLYQHSISVFYEDDNDYLWLGTEGGGLKRYHLDSKQMNGIYAIPKPENSENTFMSENYIRSVTEDLNGNFWIETFRGNSNFLFDTKNLRYIKDPGSSFVSLPDGFFEAEHLCIDRLGNYFYSTWDKGFFQLDSNYTIVRNYRHVQNDQNSISNNHVNTMSVDKSNNLWIGTRGGLNLFNRDNLKFTSFRMKDGLSSDNILSIQQDDHGNLWIATPAGITRFTWNDAGQPQIKNYPVSDPITFYAEEVSYKDNDGFIYFGGKNGFISFHPDSIRENTHIPPIMITDFKLFNESVQPDLKEKSPLQYDISETDEIILSYDQNFFSFEFAALDYADPQKNLYAYKMEGIDKDWVYSDAGHRIANYTDVQPGDYVFKVKGSNNDGVWNETPASIMILITPPWWRTTWAYSVYVILLAFTLYGLRGYDQKRQKLKHELEMEQLNAQKMAELDSMKSRFFTNISHEFRTPITLIEGPLKQMIAKKFRGNINDTYHLMLRNTHRLLNLVNQLLDLSKIELGKANLEVRRTNLVQLVKNTITSFISLAESKNIKLNLKLNEREIEAYLDIDKFEKIITNLLSNALKFTPQGGEVDVDCGLKMEDSRSPKSPLGREGGFISTSENGDERQFVEIKVSNNGPGIPPDQLDKIFDRFYQVDHSLHRQHEGTGIGLALVKELVELHHGKINVRCKAASSTVWTIFTVLLPIRHLDYQEEQLVAATDEDLEGRQIVSEYQDQRTAVTVSAQLSPGSKFKPLILVVEDNLDMRAYLVENLNDDYRIIEAVDGQDGFDKAVKKFPDLIISDIMMPNLDGYQFCNKIKTDQRVSHIPVILLTAKADLDSRIEGLEIGADDYIGKPFHVKELMVRSKNLIDQRRLLRQKFNEQRQLRPDEITVNSTDKIFLQRAQKIILDHLSDPSFSVEQFARQIGMSRIHLHRKMHALTNQSVSMFIRVIRLQKAATLLEQKVASVSEIAFEVGFNNLSYFAKKFREYFGTSPSHYMA